MSAPKILSYMKMYRLPNQITTLCSRKDLTLNQLHAFLTCYKEHISLSPLFLGHDFSFKMIICLWTFPARGCVFWSLISLVFFYTSQHVSFFPSYSLWLPLLHLWRFILSTWQDLESPRRLTSVHLKRDLTEERRPALNVGGIRPRPGVPD